MPADQFGLHRFGGGRASGRISSTAFTAGAKIGKPNSRARLALSSQEVTVTEVFGMVPAPDLALVAVHVTLTVTKCPTGPLRLHWNDGDTPLTD